MDRRLRRNDSSLSELGVDRRGLLKWGAAGAGLTTFLANDRVMLGAQGTPDAQAPAAGGEVQMHWKPEAHDTLNPLLSTDGDEQQVECLIFGALVKMNNESQPVPDLAQNIEISDDATTYTFTLHENATFSDGEPLTSEDVRFTLERAVDQRTGSYWRGRLLGIVGAEEYSDDPTGQLEGVETPDPQTVIIRLDPPDATFLVTLGGFVGMGILPKHVLQDVAPGDLAEHPFSREPTVSAGAFKFVRYETDQFIELERNDTYWGNPAPLDRIFLRIAEPEVALAQLETGDMDMAEFPIGELERVEQLSGVSAVSIGSVSMDFLAINMEREQFQDKRVRQAMMYATNRQGIVDAIYQGEATVVNQPLMYGPDWMGELPEELNDYAFDPERAGQLLEEAGWDSNTTITISFPNEAPQMVQDFLTIIREQWRGAGLNTELLARPTFEPLTQTADFDLHVVGGGVFRTHPSVSAGFLTTQTWTPDGANFGRYSNEDVDRLFQEAPAAGDPAERKSIYDEIALTLNEELPWLFLWSPNVHWGVSDRLVGFEAPRYPGNELWNAETWSVQEV